MSPLTIDPRLGLHHCVATDVKLDGGPHLHDRSKEGHCACQNHCHAKPIIEATVVDKLIDLDHSEMD